MPDERAAAGQRRQGGGRLGRDAGGAERHRGAQRAQPQPGPQPGQRAQRHPRLRDRLPRAPDLRDLDQVVHQRESREARLVGRPRDPGQPRAGVLAPREAGHLEHDLDARARSGGRRARRGRRAAAGDRSSTGAGSSTSTTRSQPSRSSSVQRPGTRASWAASAGAGTGRSRAAFRRRHSAAGVLSTTATPGSPADRAAATQARRRSVSRPSVSTTVVSPRPSRAATTVSRTANASAEASRSCGPLPTTPAQVVGRHHFLGAVAGARPRGLARARRRPPAPPEPGPGAAPAESPRHGTAPLRTPERGGAGRVGRTVRGLRRRGRGRGRRALASIRIRSSRARTCCSSWASRTHLASEKDEVTRKIVPRERKARTQGSAGM